MNWRVERIWEGETCAILAGGPSLRGFDAAVLRGRCRVIAINDSYRLMRDADLVYFCDADWLRGRIAKEPGLCPCNWIKGGEPMPEYPQIRTLRFSGQCGFDPNPGALRHGSNSGYQAIHLAAHAGAARILLLGYDMRVDVRSHWHNEERPADFAQICKFSFLPHFAGLVEPLRERGIEVINCTPGSALTCWPMGSIEEVLSDGL